MASNNIDPTGKDASMKEMNEVERVISPDEELSKDHQDYGRMDAEVAKYATGEEVHISETENKRLKKLIDKRVLTIMVFTYFLQALDKGTMSFTSIVSVSYTI
jgi:hypothetical protein